jgi:GNAT superfamily N-acetyltransferase
MIQYNFRSLAINFLARPWLLFHHEIRKNIPLIIKNLKLRLLRQKFRNKDVVDNSWKDFVPSMGLVVIGVSPEHQGKGYGTLLLKEFELRAQEEGFRKMHLSVRKNNNQAIAVYRKNGWQICNEGSEEYLMHKNLA